MTKIVKLDESNFMEVVEEASEVLSKGGLVVFPTETVYGLGADAYNTEAVKRIFHVKGRPFDNPLIVHISDLEMFYRISRDVPDKVLDIVRRLWPGPFTVVVYRGDIPPEVSAGLDTVAVRMPAHPFALKMIECLGHPVAAPSANKSGRPSPTKAEHAIEDLKGEVELIIDAGETLYGVESTVIDFTSDPPILLRPGPLTPEELKSSLGIEIHIPDFVKKAVKVDRPRSPGMKYRHYAPEARLILVESKDYKDLKDLAMAVVDIAKKYLSSYKVGVLASDETMHLYRDLGIPVLSYGSRSDLYTIAKNLFRRLREMDSLGVDIIITEGFRDEGLGLTIMNRLRKAASEIIHI